MNSITRNAIIDEVASRGWKFETIDDNRLYYKITDNRGRINVGRGGRFAGSSANGCFISRDKLLSYQFVTSMGYVIPRFCAYENELQARSFLDEQKNIVVKPSDAEQSRGVTVNVNDYDKLNKAYLSARSESNNGTVVLQKQLDGGLYRLLTIGGKFFAASYRRPAFVVGDGVSTVGNLINKKNQDPRRSDSSLTPLKIIRLDNVRECIGQLGLDEILPTGVQKNVIDIASISLGGEAEDVTDITHGDYVAIVEKISQSLKLDICGFDIIVESISKPLTSNCFPLVELNSLPGFKLHLYPTAGGISRNPAPAVLDVAFP